MILIKRRTLQGKIILLVLGFTFILCICNIVLIKEFTSYYFKRELTERGLTISRNLAESCVEPILTDDIVKLQKLVSNTKNLHEDIIYIFVQDAQKRVVVHTFGDYFPEGLVDINPLTSGQTHGVQILDTEKGIIRDIASPVLDGRLGIVHLGISEKYIKKAISSIIKRLIEIIFIVLFLGIILTYFLTIRTLSPLRKVSDALKKVGEGYLNQRIYVNSSDEIGLLVRTFNEMAEKLEKTNLELKNAQSQLIQSEKMSALGQFAAGIAHEINNPLSAIINYVRTVLSNPEIKHQDRGYLQIVLKGLFRIENIVRQILSYSVRQKFEPQQTSVNKLITDSLSFAKHKLLEHNIEVNLNLDKSLPEILIEPNHIQQVFINIINNAVDAISSNGKLAIETSFNDREVKIKFIDNGCGIKKEYLDKIFDPFYTTKESGKGVGLGLFICYNIIQIYKGTINIESEEGNGTTVIITLPIGDK